jgi:hypothetical protein
MTTTIKCDKCGNQIEITEAIWKELEEKVLQESQAKHQEEITNLNKKIEEINKSKEEEIEKVKKDIYQEAEKAANDKVKKEYDKKLLEEEEKFQKREQEISVKEETISDKVKELDEAKKLLDSQVEKKVKEATEEIEKKAKQNAEENISVELEDLKNQSKEKDEKLKEAEGKELQFRKERREFEESKEKMKLEVARKVDEGREQIRISAIASAEEEYKLKVKDRDKKIDDMKKQIEDLQRRAEQGSQQAQGEVLELELEEILNSNFPQDNIKPVQKGKEGADVIQEVINQSGHQCGTIIWESKRTKTWNEAWIDKLKDDQREAKADIAVLVSTILPKNCKGFSSINGVWVVGCELIYGLANVLRSSLIQLHSTRMAAVGKGEKMEILYNYLSGPEFKHKVEGIMEAFIGLQEDLNQEKRAMNKIWSKRQKLLDRVINNTSTMYGDIQGIIGASMPQIEALELKSLPSGIELSDSEEA